MDSNFSNSERCWLFLAVALGAFSGSAVGTFLVQWLRWLWSH